MPWWHNLVLRKPGNQAKGNQDSLFPKGFPGSNPGHGVELLMHLMFTHVLFKILLEFRRYSI